MIPPGILGDLNFGFGWGFLNLGSFVSGRFNSVFFFGICLGIWVNSSLTNCAVLGSPEPAGLIPGVY